jgi:hypothetical protein
MAAYKKISVPENERRLFVGIDHRTGSSFGVPVLRQATIGKFGNGASQMNNTLYI